MKTLILLFLFLASSNARAISEENFEAGYDRLVRPFAAAGEVKSFIGTDGIEVKYVRYSEIRENGPLVISPGRAESFLQYGELVYDLSTRGFGPIYVIDHRGQGLSVRMLKDRHKGHVEDFSDYVNDFARFVALVKADLAEKNIAKKPYLIAHSMGGAIATLYLLKDGETFKKAALISPMYGIRLPPVPVLPDELATKMMMYFRCLSKTKCQDYVQGEEGHFDPDAKFEEGNRLSSSRARWILTWKTVPHEHPEIEIGGVTSRWLLESLEATAALTGQADRLRTPTLLLQAELERVVLNDNQTRFCSMAGHYCRLLPVKGAQHQIHRETDGIRLPAIKEMIGFFTER